MHAMTLLSLTQFTSVVNLSAYLESQFGMVPALAEVMARNIVDGVAELNEQKLALIAEVCNLSEDRRKILAILGARECTIEETAAGVGCR